MLNSDREYWVELLTKLNTSTDLQAILKDVLGELCTYFDFGMGFTYEADYTSVLFLKASYAVYPGRLPETIDIEKLLTKEELEEIRRDGAISFRDNMRKTSAGEKFSQMFNAKSMVVVPVFGEAGDIIACVGIVDRRGEVRHLDEDMTFTGAVLTTLATYIKMQMYQQRLESTHKALDSILNHMGVDVYVNDFETHEILYLNESMAAPYGGVDKMVGTTCWKSLYEGKPGECDFCPAPKLLDDEGKPTKVYGWDYKRPFDGSWFRVLSAAFPWTDGRMAQVISSVDITENKRFEEKLRRMAEYDTLTDLPNRYRLNIDCEKRIPEKISQGKEGYIVFFDLDGFKAVNDNLGHVVGDELLALVGKKLMDSPLTKDYSYRYGGDEFVVLCDDSVPGCLRLLVEYLQSIFSKPMELPGHTLDIGASIGISYYPEDGNLTSELVRNADKAMYESKRKEKGSVHFYNKGALTPMDEYIKTHDIG